MEQLFRYLEKNRITNFLIREVSSPSHIGLNAVTEGEAVSFLSDGIVVIYNVIAKVEKEQRNRILKMRGASFKKRIVEMEIKRKGGIVVYPDKILDKFGKGEFNLT
jgi:KaiC/GvpD/RAD55 family RecA-like ATPase